jgi:methylaspartate mutase sigma subunit
MHIPVNVALIDKPTRRFVFFWISESAQSALSATAQEAAEMNSLIALRPGKRKRILLSTGSSDSHTWNLVFLQLLLEEDGNEVINLGPCVPLKVFMDAVKRYQPDAIVVSSVNGHGFLDGQRMAEALRSDSVGKDIPAVIGGKLGILGDDNKQYVDELIEAGFDAVFTDSSSPEVVTTYLGELASSPEQRELSS